MTINASVIGLAQTSIVKIADNFADAVFAGFKIARMSHEIAKGSHVADVTLAGELVGFVAGQAGAMLARVEVNTGPFVFEIGHLFDARRRCAHQIGRGKKAIARFASYTLGRRGRIVEERGFFGYVGRSIDRRR